MHHNRSKTTAALNPPRVQHAWHMNQHALKQQKKTPYTFQPSKKASNTNSKCFFPIPETLADFSNGVKRTSCMNEKHLADWTT